MSFSINRTVSVLRTTDTGIPLSPESEDISLTFKVSGLTISEAGNMAVVMVSADAGATYQFFENALISPTLQLRLLKVQRNIYEQHQGISKSH
ncbi:hypothetical protein L1P90_14530 [Klebsiella pneumoniae]|uniref:hypothetical protein n=1 Tax=Klebsiella pneumoniae TaxID=573 RepID=UPI00234D56F6|nr:hypothetical protein [Klebsiella pneumoniae]MDC6628610.1 hypothetical protein [Klebsiella pneumoniae]